MFSLPGKIGRRSQNRWKGGRNLGSCTQKGRQAATGKAATGCRGPIGPNTGSGEAAEHGEFLLGQTLLLARPEQDVESLLEQTLGLAKQKWRSALVKAQPVLCRARDREKAAQRQQLRKTRKTRGWSGHPENGSKRRRKFGHMAAGLPPLCG